MEELMEEQVQLVVVGTGDEEYADALRELAWRHPGSVSVNILFNEGLARRVYAGADMFIMPSRYEACGLSQMIAMRYGTVPVVRETGGLKDSVINFDKYTTPEGNGFSFVNFNAHELLFTIKRALTCYESTPLWEKVVSNAMHSDNSWNRSAQAYAELYARIAGDAVTAEPVTEEQTAEAEEEILQALKGEEEAAEGNTEAAEKKEETLQQVEEEAVAETVQEVETEPAAETVEPEPVKAPEPAEAPQPEQEEPAVKKTVKRKAPAKKKTAEKTEEKKETEKKTPAKKTAAKKTATKKTAAKKSAAVTEEAAAEAVAEPAPKKRGRKPGSKNTKKDTGE